MDNLAVDNGQVVSLVFVCGRCPLMLMAFFTFLLCQFHYGVSTLVLPMDTECPVVSYSF